MQSKEILLSSQKEKLSVANDSQLSATYFRTFQAFHYHTNNIFFLFFLFPKRAPWKMVQRRKFQTRNYKRENDESFLLAPQIFPLSYFQMAVNKLMQIHTTRIKLQIQTAEGIICIFSSLCKSDFHYHFAICLLLYHHFPSKDVMKFPVVQEQFFAS